MALVVLDASVVIAFLDANDAHHARAAVVLGQPRADDPVLPASAYAEILVDPWRRGSGAAAVVREFVTEVGIRIEPLTAEIADFAARLRSRHRTLRLPDALVLATGEVLESPVLTCDRAWPRLSNRARVI